MMRTLWIRSSALVMLLLLAGCGGQPSAGSLASPTPTPAAASATASPVAAGCSHQPTPAETEGPYFKAGSPMRTSLVQAGMSGTRLKLTGRVLTLSCQPVSGVRLDFWQADANGNYDNSGYRLRGNQSTDAAGSYALDTIIPGEYPGRTEHIHVKVQAAGKPTLTTQLYFPGVSRNQNDSIFDPRLLVALQNSSNGATATFDFVLSG
jgi:protocatechuate 3,4-dioxygenase beta subunit